jgi:farnesyl diphosphate synthase
MSESPTSPQAGFDLDTWRERRLDEFEWALDQALSLPLAPESLLEPMRYAALDGGKRMRPLLALAACEAVAGADTERLAPALRLVALRAACAVECIHVYSLVHDDMPCMDDDALRRGRATTHVRFGEASALLAGDALQTLAFSLLSEDSGVDAAVQVAWCRTLSQAAGAVGMCAGQAIDIASVGRQLSQPDLEAMHAAKTGALLRAAITMGAQAAGARAEVLRALDVFGRHLGLAFQVVDDVLDVTADTAALGKTAGKDAAQDKPTYVALMGLDGARAYAQDLHQQALDALATSGLAYTDSLRALAQQVVQRQH